MSDDTQAVPVLGFLTVVETEPHGLFGGYLVLTASGRPLEFHCTTPVKPNRAQQILYGPTLQPFLYGEQIGRTLITKAKATPGVLLTDCGPVLAVRDHVRLPAALVLPGDPEGGRHLRFDSAHVSGPSLVTFKLGRRSLAVSAQHADDERRVTEQLSNLTDGFDLAEPFQRIRDAIEEAQRGG